MFGKGLQRTPCTRKYFMGKHREVNGFLYKIQRAITLMQGHESRNLYIKARNLNNRRCHIKLRSQPLPRAPIIKLFCESNLPVLSRPFYTSRTPKTRKQNNSTFCSCKSRDIHEVCGNHFCAHFAHTKSGMFGSLGWIPMI